MSKHPPHYFRDYFRKQGEKRRAYLRERYAADPNKQKQASAKYLRTPQGQAKRKAAQNTPDAKAKRKEWIHANPERASWYRLKQILDAHGVDREWYMRTVKAQKWRCAICRTALPGMTRYRRLLIDHCHKTGTVRGLLCNGCNRGLGYFGDNAEVLRRAVKYLRKHQAVASVSSCGNVG